MASKKEWFDSFVLCPYCRHKLFRKLMSNGNVLLEVKCTSCKRVFELLVGEELDKELE